MLGHDRHESTYAQTTDHISLSLRRRFVTAAAFYNRLFIFFTLLITSELVGCLVSSKSALAFGLFATATITSLLIAYIALRFCSERREEENIQMTADFIQECHNTFSPFEDKESVEMITADGAQKLSRELLGIERSLFQFSSTSLKPAIEKLSCRLHAGAVLSLRQYLLESAAEQFINSILDHPTVCGHHKKLAIVYLEIACLYARSAGNGPNMLWPMDTTGALNGYNAAVSKAVSQLLVAAQFDPEDPWIFEQLIECYGALKEKERQLEACSRLLTISPNESAALEHVGRRYFEHGLFAEGLNIYERLKPSDPERAQSLLRVYRRSFSSHRSESP